MSNLPPAGWYADQDPRQQRWWDGTRWTEAVQPVPYSAPVAVASPRPRNGYATNALTGGITGAVVSFITAMAGGGVTPLALLFALVGVGSALGWGIPAIIRARKTQPPAGLGRATWGIAVGGTGLVVILLLFVVTYSASSASSQYDPAELENNVIKTYSDNGQQVDDVSCPAAPSFREGDSFKCVVTLTDGRKDTIVVEVQDNQGSYYWKAE